MSRAVLKKDVGHLKKGTVLEYTGGVFAHKGTTFLPEDIFFDDAHFEFVGGTTPQEYHESSFVLQSISKQAILNI